MAGAITQLQQSDFVRDEGFALTRAVIVNCVHCSWCEGDLVDYLKLTRIQECKHYNHGTSCSSCSSNQIHAKFYVVYEPHYQIVRNYWLNVKEQLEKERENIKDWKTNQYQLIDQIVHALVSLVSRLENLTQEINRIRNR